VQKTNNQNESPGTSDKHYAPKSKLVLQSTAEIQNQPEEKIVFLVIEATPLFGIQMQMPTDPDEYAR